MKTILALMLISISLVSEGAVYVPQELKLPCYSEAILAAQKQTLRMRRPVSETSLTTASLRDGILTSTVVVRAEFEEQVNSEENDIYFRVDVFRRSGKCEVLSVKTLGLNGRMK